MLFTNTFVTLLSDFFLLSYFYLERERERESAHASAGEGQREERETVKQAPPSA